MRKKILFVLTVALLAGVVLSTASAGNGKGPGDGSGPGPCTCEISVDSEPDGFCDICGGCIPEPDGDGPKGPNGPNAAG